MAQFSIVIIFFNSDDGSVISWRTSWVAGLALGGISAIIIHFISCLNNPSTGGLKTNEK